MSRSGGGILKVLFLVLFIVVLIVGGLLWFDFLGVVDVQDSFSFITNIVGIEPREPIEDDTIYLLDNERLAKQQLSVDQQFEDLSLRQQEVELLSLELTQREEEVAELELSLEEKENSLNEAQRIYDDKDKNLRQVATNYISMDPKRAVPQLEEMDVLDVVDLFRMVDKMADESGTASMVSYWLSQMDAAKAAEIQRLLIIKPF